MAGGSTWPGSGCGTSFDKSETVLARSAPEIAAQPPGHRADGERAKAHADLHRSGVNAKCGHSLLQGLESVTETLANPFWSQRLALVQHNISAGKPVWLALKNSGEFSPLCIQLVRTGEASGSLDAMLRNLAHHHGEKTPLKLRIWLHYLSLRCWSLRGLSSVRWLSRCIYRFSIWEMR